MFIMCKMADDNCDLWLLDLDLKGQNWKTQAAEMVYTTTQRLKILKGSARTQTDKKSSQINKWRVQAFHIIPNEEFYSGWFLNLHHNSVIIVVQDDAFPFCVTCPVCAWNMCPVSYWVELLTLLLDLNIKLRRLHHPYLLHIAIAMMPATFLNKATICSYSTRKLPDWQHYVKFLLRKSSKLHSFVLITICFNTSRQNLCNFHPNSFRDCLHCTEMTAVILFPSLTSGVKGCSLGVAVAQAWRLEGPDTQEGLG